VGDPADMIATLLQQYGASLRKEWSHDRLATQGSSEAGRCARQSAFAKLEVAPDPGYVPTWGAGLRGDIIELNFFVPGLRASLPPGVELLYAGDEQVTRVDGYLSATPDGLLTGISRDCLVRFGIADIGCNELLVECKSIDPRMHLRCEKPEHAYQVQVAMGVLRATTQHQPEYALLTYINASFLNDIQEFAIRFDPAIYRAAGDRARRILGASDPGELPPEGKMAGGSECKYCAWAEQCLGATIATIPPNGSELGDDAVHELKGLRDIERKLADQGAEFEIMHAAACEAIKQFLREHGVRQHRGDDWSVSWASVAGRASLDAKAMEAAGIDVEIYRKEGRPGERLIVK
jgi:hypothetical protein